MSKEIASNPRQQRFLEAVAGLNLEFPVAEISRKTGYAEGTVSPNLKITGDAPTKFIRRVSEAFNLDSEAIISGPAQPDTKTPASSDAGEVIPDPQMPGIYQNIINELIESSKAQRQISGALLEERQLIRETANAAITLATTATNNINIATKDEVKELRTNLDTVQDLVDENFAWIRSLEQLAVYHGGKLAGKTPEQIEGILRGIHEQVLTGKQQKKTSSKTTTGN